MDKIMPISELIADLRERRRHIDADMVEGLYEALAIALPALELLATEEARANMAPTGMKRTGAAGRAARAREALAKARGE